MPVPGYPGTVQKKWVGQPAGSVLRPVTVGWTGIPPSPGSSTPGLTTAPPLAGLKDNGPSATAPPLGSWTGTAARYLYSVRATIRQSRLKIACDCRRQVFQQDLCTLNTVFVPVMVIRTVTLIVVTAINTDTFMLEWRHLLKNDNCLLQ